MARAPWHIIGALEDIDDSVFVWESMFKSSLDNHIKKRIVKIRDRSLPWMNTEIRKAMNLRYKYLREAHVNPGNNKLWCRYKQQRNKVKAMIRKAEAAYWINLFENANSPGDFWKVTNRILKKSKIKKCGPIQDNNGNIITASEQKADYFNDFFLNIALDVTRDLSQLPSDTTTFIYKVCPTMSSFSVEWNIVQEIVQKSLNPNKAMGLDNISQRDLKLCESSVVQGLFEICMKSRADCQFPISWKKSQVAAVFKKGNRLDVNNYRPISLLSIPSKILERLVCRSFNNHLTSHSLLSDRQWGFRKGHSTESLPWYLTEVWKEALDDGLKGPPSSKTHCGHLFLF